MLGLRDYQRCIAAALLTGETGPAALLIASDGIPPDDRLRIHRNTMLTVLINALSLSYPAVEALVGVDFFAQVARGFILDHPPQAALLTGYGGSFHEFIANYSQLRGQPYLPDVARLEWAVEMTARKPEAGNAPSLADVDIGGTRLALVPSLITLATGYHVEPIWRAALENDGDTLSSVDSDPKTTNYAIWRAGDGAAISVLGVGSAAFLEELIAGGDAESAVNAAATADLGGDPVAAITAEILPAGFAQLTPT